jgi:hypothetical protein
MGEPSLRTPQSADRLDSWKEIAAYLKRDVRTVQRREKREEMPVTVTCMTGLAWYTRPRRSWMRGCAAGIGVKRATGLALG